MYKPIRLGIWEILIHSVGILLGLFLWKILWIYSANGVMRLGLVEHIGFLLWIGLGNLLLVLMALNIPDSINNLALVQTLLRGLNLLLLVLGIMTMLVFLSKNYTLFVNSTTEMSLLVIQACIWLLIHLNDTQTWKWEATHESN